MNTPENMVDSASQLILSHENDLIDLQENSEELRVLQPVKAGEETGPEQSSNDHRDSAGRHTRLFQVLKKFCELHTQSVCMLREVLCSTANTLTERRMYSNLTHTPRHSKESQETTADVGKCFMRGLGSL